MKKHIHKVIKWLEDPESVSQEERDKNREEAKAVYNVVNDAVNDAAYNAAYNAANAAYFAADNDTVTATEWVNRYFEITEESKQDYINAIGAEK